MSYNEIDDGISAWAARHGLKLITEFGGHPRRFCYISGGKNECYQISVEPPAAGTVTINAWDVETRNDAEFHRTWDAPVADLSLTLEEATEQVAQWMRREP